MRLELGEISDDGVRRDRARRPRAHPRDQGRAARRPDHVTSATRSPASTSRASTMTADAFDSLHLLRRQGRRRQDDLRRRPDAAGRGARRPPRARGLDRSRALARRRARRAAVVRARQRPRRRARGTADAAELDAPRAFARWLRRPPRGARRHRRARHVARSAGRRRAAAALPMPGIDELDRPGRDRPSRRGRYDGGRRRHRADRPHAAAARRSRGRRCRWSACSTRCSASIGSIREQLARVGRPEAADRLIAVLAAAGDGRARAAARSRDGPRSTGSRSRSRSRLPKRRMRGVHSPRSA